MPPFLLHASLLFFVADIDPTPPFEERAAECHVARTTKKKQCCGDVEVLQNDKSVC